jgi:hypothetical protein
MATARTPRGSQTRKRASVLARMFLGGCLFLGAGVGSIWSAPPAVSKMLEYSPRQDVVITTPAAAEQAGLKVELDKGARGSGWVLKDASGKTLRRFYSHNNRDVDTWSYYADGVEVHRQLDTTGSGRPDQYRWLNTAGSKWGVDVDKDGTIDTWKVISPEEVSQEALRALATRNLARLQALLMTDDDIKALGLPAEQAESIREKRKGLKEKFEATIAKLPKLTEKAVWRHLETGAPQTVPADVAGTSADIVKHARATVLFESGGTNDWVQIGPLVQVGTAWRLIDAPRPGSAVEESGEGPKAAVDMTDPKVEKLIKELTELDKQSTSLSGGPAVVRHHLQRSDVLEKIIATVKPQERDPWIRQVADSLSTAAQASPAKETTAATRLASLEKQLVQYMPGSNLTGYVVFRGLQADYNLKLSAAKDVKDAKKVQQEWVEKLTKYVQTYGKADDTPDAILQAGMACEFLDKDVEAKNWYASLARNFADKPQGAKGAGAALRLELEGKPFRLAGPLLGDAGTAYDLEQARGKVVIVYYWASWNGQAASDFAKLKTIVDASNKTVELVCVNLDNTPEEAKGFLSKNPAPGVHLYQSGGLDGKLATQYGVLVLPGMFVVGRDGKCVSRNAQVGTIEEEIKKHVKK